MRVTFHDFVYNETNVFIRKVTIDNLADRIRDFRIIFHNDLEVGAYTHGVTSFAFVGFHRPDSVGAQLIGETTAGGLKIVRYRLGPRAR
jgi:hypothetical protein